MAEPSPLIDATEPDPRTRAGKASPGDRLFRPKVGSASGGVPLVTVDELNVAPVGSRLVSARGLETVLHKQDDGRWQYSLNDPWTPGLRVRAAAVAERHRYASLRHPAPIAVFSVHTPFLPTWWFWRCRVCPDESLSYSDPDAAHDAGRAHLAGYHEEKAA